MLTSISKRYSKKKIVRSVGCSKLIVKKALDLRAIEGPFSYPKRKRVPVNQISNELKSQVIAFYKNPNFSRTQPISRES